MNVKLISIWLAGIMFASLIISFVIFSVSFSLDTPQKNSFYASSSINYSDSIDSIVVNGRSIDVEINPTTENVFGISLSGFVQGNSSYDPELIVEQNGTVLNIVVDESNSQFKPFHFWGYEDMTLKLFIPSVYSSNLSVDLASGNILIKDFSLDDILLDSKSGDILASNIFAQNLDFSLASGDANFKNINSSAIVGSVLSGNIVLSGSSSSKVTLGSASGDIVATFNSVTGPITAKAISGNVVLDLPDTLYYFDLNTLSGNVVNRLKNNTGYSAGNSSSPFLIKASSTSGDIVIR